jgi:CheY-like chemotaxis protein
MDIRTQLLKIPELNTGKLMWNMTAKQVDDYVLKLNAFIDGFPALETQVREALGKVDIASTSKYVRELWEMLVNIAASKLADDCWKHLNEFDNMKFERISSYVNLLLSTMAALSIDIQMAVFRSNADEMGEDTFIPEPDKPATAPITREVKKKTIMAVDDDPDCLNQLKFALKEVPCKIIGVTSGSDAVEISKTQKPDMLVLDIEMPSMDGIVLAKKMRRMGHKCPILFITGKANKEYVVRAVNADASDFILKPIDPDNVVLRICRFL